MAGYLLYWSPMKAHSVELRERVVRFVERGGKKSEAALHFEIGERSVYRFLKAARDGCLAPKPQGGSAKKFGDDALRREVKAKPSATLEAHGRALGVSHAAVWKRLRKLAITLKKKTDPLHRAGRVPEAALPHVAPGRRGPGRPRVLP